MKIFSFDAETDGLYGKVWAIGAVVLDGDVVVAEFAGQTETASVTDPWVIDNIVPVVNLRKYDTRADLLEAFWAFWMLYRGDSVCVADFGAPVEAGLFRACVERDLAARMWLGPYPMHELGTALLLAGIDPDVNRRELAGRDDLVDVTRRHKPPLRRPANWGRAIAAKAAAVPLAPDPDWDAWDGIPELVKSTAETFGLDVDDLHCHLEGQHGWEPHDIGYEVAVGEAAACAQRSVAAGGSARECLRLGW